MRHYYHAVICSFAMLAASLPAHALAAEYSLSLTPSSVQTMRYDRGVAQIYSAKSATIVRVAKLDSDDEKSVSFVISIANLSAQPFNFGPENVIVRPSGMSNIALVTYEQAVEAVRKRQGRDKFWAGVAAFGRNISAAEAGTSYSSGIYSGTTHGYVGSNHLSAQSSGIYSVTHHNPAAAFAAQRNAQAMNAADLAKLEAEWAARSSSHDSMLRTTTVDPARVYGGIATFALTKELKKAREPVQMLIEVTVAREKHIFLAQLSKAD